MGKGILAAFITLVVGLLTMSVFTGAEEVGVDLKQGYNGDISAR